MNPTSVLAELIETIGTQTTGGTLDIPKLLDYQQPPQTGWDIWLLMGGRGIGKNVAGAAWAAEQAEVHQPGHNGLLIGPEFRAVREVMVEGPTGLLKTLGDRVDNYNRSTFEITTTSGSRIYMRSADTPEPLRGLNLAWAWCDEIGSWKYPAVWHEGLVPALRAGNHPQTVVTTTPRPTELIKHLVAIEDGRVHRTTATTFDNPHLPESAIRSLKASYEGTRIGRQELYLSLIHI